MIEYRNGGRLVEEAIELPVPNSSWSKMYLDLETSSGDPKIKAVNPWHNCYTLGIALTCDDWDKAFYVPLQHHHGKNLDLTQVQRWVIDVFDHCDVWINHNVKFDVQVMFETFGVDWVKPVFDTLTQAKLVNSDRFSYALDGLAKDWLGFDISKYEEAMQPYLVKNKDYAAIPSDIMGEYACEDVFTARRLHKYIVERMPECSQDVSKIENETCKVLIDIERNGLKVNPTQLQVTEYQCLNSMTGIQQRLHDEVGFTFDPMSNGDCFDVICNKYGFPVLGYTDTGNPSFDKDTLKNYLALPEAPTGVIDQML